MTSNPNQSPTKSGAHIIVFGNEKGGSGKSTSAMHTAVALLRMGYKVGTIDLDARQGTFTRYFRNRFEFVTKNDIDVPSPIHMPIYKCESPVLQEKHQQEKEFLMMALDELNKAVDFVVIDTPGTDSYLSRLAHSYADTLVTPMNDSFVDLDLLVDLDPDNYQVRSPSVYTKMVKKQLTLREARDFKKPNWIVMRNRMSHLNARNKREIEDVLNTIAGICGFRVAPGFSERVVFKELFLKGLTLLDLEQDPDFKGLSMSNLAARQEVRNLIRAIGPEQYKSPPKQRRKKKAA